MTRRKRGCVTPAQAAGFGAAAGVAGTLVITLLVRFIPELKPAKASKQQPKKLPADPFQEQKVAEWQDRSRSPAAHSQPEPDGETGEKAQQPAAGTPAGALAETQGPGPEGAAELFFVKLGSGLFDRDFSKFSKPAGKILHGVYGAFWGLVYGLAQGRRRHDPWLGGTLHGIVVWGIGPAWLVPSMHLLPSPRHAAKRQTALMAAGHVLYGITVAKLFDALAQGRK